MTDEILRLGIDTSGVDDGARKAGRGYDEVAKGARSASDANEKLERVMQETGKRSASAAQAMEQSSRANRAMAESTNQAARSQDVYRRAVRERLATEREVARMAMGETQMSAVGAAEAFVRAQESYYRQNMARVKLAAAQGLITPQEASAQGRQAAEAYNSAIAGVVQRRGAFQNDRQAFTTLAGSLKDVADSGRSGSLGMHRLNNSLIVLARQATNTHPVVGQLTDVIGTFAIGTARMVPILAGVAALGFAWNALTRDARGAKEEHERLRDILEDIAERRRIAALGPGGEANTAVEFAQAQMARIANEVAEIGSRPRYRPGLAEADDVRARVLAEQYESWRQLVVDGEEAIADARRRADEEAERERERAARERHQAHLQELREQKQFTDAMVAAIVEGRRRRLEAENIDVRMERQQRDIDEARAGAQARVGDEINRAIAEDTRRLQRQINENAQADARAMQAQEQALQKLVQALNNVGRAYGGVTDQLLALTSAALALDRMPMDTKRDRLTAYGTAAATGIGIGASTGSFALGGVGGAAAGFSMAGPYGAIVGGVTGIVSGLMEQGSRAAAAAQAWDKAMTDWERSYEKRTTFQQQFDQLEQQWNAGAQQAQGFAGVSGPIPDPDAARAFVDFASRNDVGAAMEAYARMLEQQLGIYEKNTAALEEMQRAQEAAFVEDLEVRKLEALGRDEEADRVRLRLQQEREMQRAIEQGWTDAARTELEYVQGLEREKAAKDALNEAIRDVTSAMNAPDGLNLSLYRWRANMMPSMDTARPPRSWTGATGTGGDYDRPDRRGGDVTIENMEINVDGSGQPEVVAREVYNVFQREALRGDGNPLEFTTR